MSGQEYVMGIDIGGTKSHLAIFDTDGNFIDLGHWGGLNHEGMKGSFNQLEDLLGQFITQVLEKNNIPIDKIAYSTIGESGVDTTEQHGIITEIYKRLGFKNFTLVNDAYLGIPAGSLNGVGICAINGTGCTLAGLNKNGDMLQIGGLGYITADMGGGGYFGASFISAVYRELFRKGEPTVMTKMMFEKLGITSKYDYIEKITKTLSDGSFRYSKLTPMVFEAVRQKDNVACKIMLDSAASYANGISAMIEELRFPKDDELYVVLAGSVFVKGEDPLLVDTLKEKLSADNPEYNIKYNLLNVPNVAGAVIWALNSLNSNVDFYDKVCAQLKN